MMQGWIKYLKNERGEVAPGGIEPGSNGTPTPSDWREPFKADPEIYGALEKRTEKDLPTFIKSSINLEKKLGTSLVPPGKDARPEDVQAFKAKVYGTGTFKAPPDAPEKYEVTRPENVPEQLWSPDLEKDFRGVLHKHGIDNEAAKEIAALYHKQVSDLKAAIQYDQAETKETVTKWCKENGLSYEQAENYAGQWMRAKLSERNVAALNASGLGNDPGLIETFAKCGMALGEDVSFMDNTPVAGAADANKEIHDIQYNTAHPDHQRWLDMHAKNDKEMIDKMAALYARTTGGR